jgi:hypothetical protein
MNDIGSTTDFIQLGPLVNEYTPERTRSRVFHGSVWVPSDGARVPNAERRRSSLPVVDIDGNQMMVRKQSLLTLTTTLLNCCQEMKSTMPWSFSNFV